MAQLLYSVDFEPWAAPLREARRRLISDRTALAAMGKIGVAAVLRNIDDRGGTIQWPDLSAATLIARARNPSGRATTGGRQVFKSRASMGPASAREARVLAHDSSASANFARVHLGQGRNLTKRARKVIENAEPLKWTKALYRDIRYRVGNGYVDIGSTLKKARTLFFGSAPGKRPKVPARSPFGFTAADGASMMRIYVGHVLGVFKKGGPAS